MYDMLGSVQTLHAISCGSAEYRGMHFLSEDYCILELLDPETGQKLDFADGVTGEYVFTYLDWEGTPFLRYRMGDIMQVFTEPCPCGWPEMRLKLLGRTDDMLIVKGINIYPSAIKNILERFAPRVTGAFRIVLDRPGHQITPPLRLKVEHGEGLEEHQLAELKKEIEQYMSETARVRPEITFIPPFTLDRSEHKTRYIEIETNN
jgi:phenylacetate-CoA ligase